MSRKLEDGESILAEFFFYQDIVSIECRDREDWNRAFGKGPDERRQHARLGKRKWTFEFETDPSSFRLHFCGYAIFYTDHREFVRRAADGIEA